MEKARVLVLDVETLYTRDAVISERIRQEAMDKKPAQNVAKAKKEVWQNPEERILRGHQAVEKTSMDVLLAEVLCCVVSDGVRLPGMLWSFDGMSDTEGVCLLALAEHLSERAGPDTIWGGHGIEGFDLPILLNRWRCHEIQPPEHFPVYRRGRWLGRVYDTMQNAPCKNGLGLVSLNDVCAAYGLGAAKTVEWRGEPMDGSRVAAAYEAGEYGLLLGYCAGDVESTMALIERMTFDFAYGFGGRREEVGAAIRDLRESDLTDTQRRLAEHALMDMAGLIPG